MEAEGIQVNKGGLYDNKGLIDSLIVDCNTLPKLLINNHFIAFGSLLSQMVQKLGNLKEGIDKDMKAKDEAIADLRRINDELAEKLYHVPAERTGDDT